MNYEKYMNICIQLAKKGEGNVSPNPLVGCVVLDEHENIISEGYHAKYGEFHAERNALNKIEKGEGHTLFVNLEPCSHYGKTPPCTDIIIEKGIKKVVFGMSDVNPKVSGKKVLQDAGIEVVEGVLEKECKELNEIFIKNMTKDKPFIAIKTATTLDGKIATYSGSSKWITSDAARNEVKVIRNRYDAIMTSSSTVINDNPTMEHKNKIILDRELKCDIKSKIFNSGNILIFYDGQLKLNKTSTTNIRFIPAPIKNSKIDLDFVFKTIYEMNIKSVLLESGGKLNGSVIEFADKIYHFIAPKIVGDNSALSCFDYRHIFDINQSEIFKFTAVQNFEPDILITYYPIVKKY